eukprot:PhF_6_TR11540/c0_g1_i1/m.18532
MLHAALPHVVPPAALNHHTSKLREAMQSGDIVLLETAIESAVGSLGYSPDHSVIEAQRLLHAWQHRVRTELVTLRTAMHTKNSREIIKAIQITQQSPHARALRTDVIKAKALLAVQEQAMKEVEAVITYRDPISMSEFLRRFKDALPNEVIRELTDLRRQFVKEKTTTAASFGDFGSPNEGHDGLFSTVESASVRLRSATPPRGASPPTPIHKPSFVTTSYAYVESPRHTIPVPLEKASSYGITRRSPTPPPVGFGEDGGAVSYAPPPVPTIDVPQLTSYSSPRRWLATTPISGSKEMIPLSSAGEGSSNSLSGKSSASTPINQHGFMTHAVPPPNLTSSTYKSPRRYFEDEIKLIENSERTTRCEVLLHERNDRITMVKLMMYDLHRVKEGRSLYSPGRSGSSYVSSPPPQGGAPPLVLKSSPIVSVVLSQEKSLRNEYLAEESSERLSIIERFHNIRRALEECDNKYKTIEPVTPLSPGRAHNNSITNASITSSTSQVVPQEQYTALYKAWQDQQWQYILSMHASQLCLTYERQRAERAEIANDESSMRLALFAVFHASTKFIMNKDNGLRVFVPAPIAPEEHSGTFAPTTPQAVLVERAVPLLLNYESISRVTLERASDNILKILRELQKLCVARDDLVQEESSSWEALEQPALATLWSLYSEALE